MRDNHAARPAPPSLSEWLVFAAYQSLFGAALLPALALTPLLRRWSRRVRQGSSHLLGHLPRPPAGPLVWLHGVSQGESMVAISIGEALKREHPHLRLGLTTTHPDVLSNARTRTQLDVTGYAPLDALPLTSRALHRWNPRLIVITETDFWPCLSLTARQRSIPLVLINGRISEKLHRFYSHVTTLGRLVFGSFSLLAVQSETDRGRLLDMGAPSDRIAVLGNVKADLAAVSAPEATRVVSRFAADRPLVVFGSLHPIEFQTLTTHFQELIREGDCRLLIAPRNVSLAREWRDHLANTGIVCALRSEMTSTHHRDPVAQALVLDTMGELGALYALARAAFVGGSLAPSVGGHNPIEAIRYRVPTVVGPHTRNFADLIQDLTAADAIRVETTARAVTASMLDLVRDTAKAVGQATRAERVLNAHQGAIRRTLTALSPFLPH